MQAAALGFQNVLGVLVLCPAVILHKTVFREVARHEKTLIPEDFEYAALTGLTLEAREKLARIRPRNLGQAGRIPGVSPSDVAQLSIALAGK